MVELIKTRRSPLGHSDYSLRSPESDAFLAFLESLPWPALALNEEGGVICLNKEMRLSRSDKRVERPETLQTLFPEYFQALGGKCAWFKPQEADVVRECPEGPIFEHLWLRRVHPSNAHILIVMDQTKLRLLETTNAQTARLAGLGFMVASVCHEVSNPLTAIHSMVQILQSNKQASSDLIEKGLSNIAANVTRILELSRRLVGYSRVVNAPRARFQIDEVIEDALVSLRQERLCEQISIEHTPNPDVVMFGDRGQLQEVFFNIFQNAIQAMQGEGRLSISSRRIDSKRIEVVIEDTGPGIPPQLLTKIFEPFFTTKPTGQGTGLGLAICNEIVNEHGGTLRVENGERQGARFSVQLPQNEESR